MAKKKNQKSNAATPAALARPNSKNENKPAIVTIQPKSQEEELPPIPQEVPETPLGAAPEEIPPQPAPLLPESEPPVEQQQSERPRKPKTPPLELLESITKASGEVIKVGDKIQVQAPWGGEAIAEITLIYQSDSGEVWAQYKPIEPVKEGWQWSGGVTRAELLTSASAIKTQIQP